MQIIYGSISKWVQGDVGREENKAPTKSNPVFQEKAPKETGLIESALKLASDTTVREPSSDEDNPHWKIKALGRDTSSDSKCPV